MQRFIVVFSGVMRAEASIMVQAEDEEDARQQAEQQMRALRFRPIGGVTNVVVREVRPMPDPEWTNLPAPNASLPR